MSIKKIVLLSASVILTAAPLAFAAGDIKNTRDGVSWGYVGQNGASKWGGLSKDYRKCSKGRKQSPINIDRFMEKTIEPLKVRYAKQELRIANTGHTAELHFEPGSKMVSDGVSYELSQVDFRTPSEHYLDGTPYPMEIQFLHETANGKTAVLSVMVKVGKHNDTIEKIWDNIPEIGEAIANERVEFAATDLLPRTGIYFRYDGSLTTPPCTEGVKWHVMQDPIEISEKQLVKFQSLFPLNARPLQPLNGRSIIGG